MKRTFASNPKEHRPIGPHRTHEQAAIEEQVPHFAARLCDEQAAMARGPVRRAILAWGSGMQFDQLMRRDCITLPAARRRGRLRVRRRRRCL
jgi:hypothetical protein